MRQIIISGDKKLVQEQLESALEDVKEGNPGYVSAKEGTPPADIEFSPCDPSEDPEGDWSELEVEYREVPDS